jgi:hypothetical protein
MCIIGNNAPGSTSKLRLHTWQRKTGRSKIVWITSKIFLSGIFVQNKAVRDFISIFSFSFPLNLPVPPRSHVISIFHADQHSLRATLALAGGDLQPGNLVCMRRQDLLSAAAAFEGKEARGDVICIQYVGSSSGGGSIQPDNCGGGGGGTRH